MNVYLHHLTLSYFFNLVQIIPTWEFVEKGHKAVCHGHEMVHPIENECHAARDVWES